jgi:histidinol-phosphate aminotransferase
LHGARTINVPRDADFRVDIAGIRQMVERESPRLLFLTSPNNPDGSVITADELTQLLALPVLIVLDEAYVEFYGHSYADWALTHDNLIIFRTFSKWAGLAGVRVGYGVFPTALMPHLWKIKQPYNISVPAQEAAIASLNAADELMETVRAIVTERSRLMAGLQEIDWLQPYPSHSNFILCRVNGRSAWDVKLALRQQGILIRYFNKPGVADCLRFSVGRPEHTDLLLDALRRLQ